MNAPVKAEVAVYQPKTIDISKYEKYLTDPNCDIEKLERMLAIQKEIIAKEEESEFNMAFQALISALPILKKIRGGHSGKYTPFEHIWSEVKPIVVQHGFSIRFETDTDIQAKFVIVECYATHRNGMFKKSKTAIPFDTSGSKNAAQAVGSALSYGKRYTLTTLLNIATYDEDDDANNAIFNPITDAQIKMLQALWDFVNDDQKALFVGSYGEFSEIDKRNFNHAQAQLQKFIKTNRGAQNANP